jgi:hypothetical protein
MSAIRIIDDHIELASTGSNTHAQIDTHISEADDYIKRDGMLTVLPGQTIQGAIDSITDATIDKPYAVLISPGVYDEKLTLKAHVYLKGYGPSTIIKGTGITYLANILNMGKFDCGASDLVVDGTRTGVYGTDSSVIKVSDAGSLDIVHGRYLNNIIVKANGLGAGGITVSGSYRIALNNCTIITEGVGLTLKNSPQVYAHNCHIALVGASVGCNHKGVYIDAGYTRLYWFGGRIGTGYGYDEITGDTDKIFAALHSAAASDYARIELHNLESYVRSENHTDGIKVNVIRAEGASWFRCFGCFGQAEAPPTWLNKTIYNGGSATIENHSCRFSDASNDDVVGSSQSGVYTLTANTTIEKFEGGLIKCEPAAANITLTFATSKSKGDSYFFQKTNSNAYTVTINGGGVNINGAATYTLSKQYDAVGLIYNGSEFTIIDGSEKGLTKVSTTTVAFNATGQTTLYTVPVNKIFIPAIAFIRAGADAALTDVTFGRVGALTDWLNTIQLDNLDAAGDQVKVEQTNANPPTQAKTYAAGTLFQVDVTVAQGGATNYIDLFGYLINA